MKQLTKLEKYVPVPNVGFFGGFRYDGEDVFLCDDRDLDGDYAFSVRQRIENGVLITDLEKTYTLKNGKRVAEQSHLTVELDVGQLLIYVEGVGFTLPEYRMCPVEEAIGQYKLLL